MIHGRYVPQYRLHKQTVLLWGIFTEASCHWRWGVRPDRWSLMDSSFVCTWILTEHWNESFKCNTADQFYSHARLLYLLRMCWGLLKKEQDFKISSDVWFCALQEGRGFGGVERSIKRTHTTTHTEYRRQDREDPITTSSVCPPPLIRRLSSVGAGEHWAPNVAQLKCPDQWLWSIKELMISAGSVGVGARTLPFEGE